MKLLLDEMWPQQIAVQLRRRGHDVIAVTERPDLQGTPDAVVLAVARLEGRAIVTENVRDFRPLAVEELRQGRSHAGLILTRNRRFPRGDPQTFGYLITALDRLVTADPETANVEHWLS